MYRGILWFLYSKTRICFKKNQGCGIVTRKSADKTSLAKSVVTAGVKGGQGPCVLLSPLLHLLSTSQIFRDKKRNWGVPCWPGSEHSRLSLPWPGFNPGQGTEAQQSYRAPHPGSGSTFHLANPSSAAWLSSIF